MANPGPVERLPLMFLPILFAVLAALVLVSPAGAAAGHRFRVVAVVRRLKVIPALFVVAVLVALADPAGAMAVVHTGAAHDTTTNSVLGLPWITLAVSGVIPIIVNVVVSSTASSALKSGTLLVLSALTAALSTIIDSGGVFIGTKFAGAVVAVILTAQGSHIIVGKGLGVYRLTSSTAGIGKPKPPRR